MERQQTAGNVKARTSPPWGERIVQMVKDNAPFVLAIALAVVLWEVYVRLFEVPQYILPAPTASVRRMVVKQDLLLEHAGWTLYETLLGFFVGVAVGFPLAIAIVYSKLAEKTLFTFLVSSQAIPKVTLAPVLVALLGFGGLPKIVIAFLICFLS